MPSNEEIRRDQRRGFGMIVLSLTGLGWHKDLIRHDIQYLARQANQYAEAGLSVGGTTTYGESSRTWMAIQCLVFLTMKQVSEATREKFFDDWLLTSRPLNPEMSITDIHREVVRDMFFILKEDEVRIFEMHNQTLPM